MKKLEYTKWLEAHKKRINRALDLYCEALIARKSASLINARYSRLVDLIDDTDQLGAAPKGLS